MSEEPIKKKRRTKAEMEAARSVQEAKELVAVVTADTALKKLDSVVGAISFLAKAELTPGDYSDIYSLMKDCIQFKRLHNLSDTKFIELMNCFDERCKPS